MTVIPPASGVTLHDGDTMDVSYGASVDGTWILTGGSQTVGGSSTTSTATNTNIFGGEQDVVFNGLASHTIIYQGVQRVTGQYVHEGPSPGKADHTAIDGGEQDVDTGIASATTVNSGGAQNVTNGGSASETIVNSGGVLRVSGETVETAPVYPPPVIRSVATAATINYQGEFDVTGGGTAVNAVVHGGVMTVSGSIPDPFANVPGQPAVDASTATGTTVSGGTLTVSDGALVSGTILQNLGKLDVEAGGTATGTTINFGTMQLSAGATATDITVNQYGILVVLGQANFSGAVFNAGSALEIGDGASETGFVVANGVTLDVLDGGALHGGIVAAGGTLMLEAGAKLSDTTFQSGATFIIEYGYAESDFTVSNGLTFKVFGGTAANTTILAGGKQIVGNFGDGGSATNTVINGGEQDVELLATASYTTINMGGIQHVAGLYVHDEPGPGRADHTIVNNGGEQNVDTGIVLLTTVNAGGVQNLTNGGIASNTIVESGGVINASGETVYYSPGGYYATVIRSEFDSADVNSGGQLHLTGAGIAKNAIIDGGVMTVSGSIPDPITNDPNAPAVDASEASGTIVKSGSISVSDGGIVTSTTLNGGTLDVLAQGTANATTIDHGATELVEAGGMVGATTIAGGMLDLKAGAIADDVITFAGQGTLKIEQKLVSGPSFFASEIKGLAIGDQIDLAGLSYASGATATVSGSTLTVSNGTASETFTLADTSVAHFGITKDSAGGVLLTAAALPAIVGTVSGQTTSNEAAINPFATVAITDPNAAATDGLIITLAGAPGILSGIGLISLGNGTYELAATDPAKLTAELHGLTFVSSPHGDGSATTNFTLSDTSSVGLTVTDANTSVTDTHQTGPTMINGPASGYAIIEGTTGNDIIHAYGIFNTIHGNGGNDAIYAGLYGTVDVPSGDSTVFLEGFDNRVSGGDGNVAVKGATGATMIALGNGNDTIDASGYGNIITLGDGKDIVHPGDGASTTTAGNGNDQVTLSGFGNKVVLGNGDDVVSGGGGANNVTLGDGNNTVDLGGMVNQITVGSGTNTIIAGNGLDNVVAGAGHDTIALGGVANHVVLNGSTANVTNQIGQDVMTANGGSDQFNFVGFGNQAIINGPAHVDIIDHSTGLTVSINSSTQIDSISGFGNDVLGVVDLANGVGNYHSVADIMNALKGDGHGGTVLALGSAPNAGSIDFVDTAISQLHASNFVIV
ncbi:autotransporter passenger strand-loop-strand repeat-containing protein [Bradyrhizobium sp. Ghvi]|uniref:AIDA repeat-containing protein n=1 Tax=Bradyrhizobium sp. Ghvi TaxID=1855319 RepID=UPI0008F18FA4|nr:AIDA repeat-containing protein [Bradyrhizobium sp. Ghvi]SFO99664.1 autotransporter passenger strand-loop-strand repeat-containing protein [Bradyrhizobium sp. Ghvi]